MNSSIKTIAFIFFLFTLLLGIPACGHKHDKNSEDHAHEHDGHDHDGHDHEGHDHDAAAPMIKKAVCHVYPTEGNKVTGTVIFTPTEGGTNVEIDIKGLTPGKHGFHIHEFGDCSAADGTSAGGHFNPDGHSHGSQSDGLRHAGDLGNLDADASGNAKITFLDKVIKLHGANTIVGRSIIIHENEDDLKTQPTGNAGARVACGSIVVGQ